MKRISILILGVAFFLTLAMSAQAIPVSDVKGKWTDLTVVDPSNVSGLGTNEIGWGTLGKCCCCSLGKNGLLFEGANDPDMSTVFSLGTLTHFNSPIRSGTGAKSAVLNLAFNIGGTAKAFNLTFGIDETPNSSTAPADIISLPTAFGSYAFSYNGDGYILELLGFGEDAASIISKISTDECTYTPVPFWAKVTTSVPEPAPLLLIGLGLVGLAGFKRKLKR